MTSGTRSAGTWQQPEFPCGRCGSGSATATSPTTLIYADYQPSAREADLVDDAFRGAEVEIEPLTDPRAVA
jgi:hypothetical protein